MPCHAAVDQKSLSVDENKTVEEVLALMRKNKQSTVAVVAQSGEFLGVFSYITLIKNILPVSVTMNDGVQMDLKVSAAPGIAKRLKKVLPLPVHNFLQREVVAIHPDTPIWQGVSLLVQHGEPVVVLDQGSKKFVGFMAQGTAYEELERLMESEE